MTTKQVLQQRVAKYKEEVGELSRAKEADKPRLRLFRKRLKRTQRKLVSLLRNEQRLAAARGKGPSKAAPGAKAPAAAPAPAQEKAPGEPKAPAKTAVEAAAPAEDKAPATATAEAPAGEAAAETETVAPEQPAAEAAADSVEEDSAKKESPE